MEYEDGYFDNISQMSLIEDGDCLKNAFDKNFRYSTLYRLKDEVQLYEHND